MRKDLKNRVPANCAIDKNLNAKLVEFSKEIRIPKSRLLDEAIIDLLKKYERED